MNTCDYCYIPSAKLSKPTYLRQHLSGWTTQTYSLCDNCRSCMKGYFKYVKEDKPMSNEKEIKSIDDMKYIASMPDGERIVAMTVYAGRLFVASTRQRAIREWFLEG